MRIIILLFIASNLVCCGQKNRKNTDPNSGKLEFKLDSVFITAFENKPVNDPPYIFSHYTVNNNTNDTIHVTMRRFEFETFKADPSYSIFQGDTLKLFGGSYTPNKFTIAPKSSMHLDIHPDPMDLMDQFDKKKQLYTTEQAFLKDVALKSVHYLFWNNQKFQLVVDDPNKIKFRDPNDIEIVDWK